MIFASGGLRKRLYPVQCRGKRTKPKGFSIMSQPIRTFLPLVTAAILACAAATPALAEAPPARSCGVDRTDAVTALHRDPPLPAHGAACHLTVFFDTGSAILTPEARRALDQAATEVIAHLAGGGRVRINGHALPGSPDETAELSRRRANAVAAYLEAAWGIPQRRLVLRGWWAVHADGGEPPGTAENRRATLVLVHGLPAATDRLTRPTAPQVSHLDLDDFGGARNPLPGPVIRIWAAPDPRHD